jgi:hypothetical protein
VETNYRRKTHVLRKEEQPNVASIVRFNVHKRHFNSTEISVLKKETIWTYLAQAGIKSSPAVADGVLYFGCEDWAVHAIPEFPSEIILSLFMILSAIFVTFAKKRAHKNSNPFFL